MAENRPAGDDVLRTSHGRVASLLGLFGLWHLANVHQAFDGDYLSARVLGEVAHHNIGLQVAVGDLTGFASDGFVDLLRRDGELQPCNAYSIAVACGLPPETVRRKVAALVERGWLARSENGDLFVTSEPGRHFVEFNREMEERVLMLADQIRAARTAT